MPRLPPVLQPAQVNTAGFARLLKVAGRLIADNAPDARDGAKQVAASLHAAFVHPSLEGVLDVQVGRAALLLSLARKNQPVPGIVCSQPV